MQLVGINTAIALVFSALVGVNGFVVPENTGVKSIRARDPSNPLSAVAAAEETTTSSNDSVQNPVGEKISETVEFPPALSKIDRIKRAATFWSTGIPIVLSYYGLISRLKLEELLGLGEKPEDEIERMWDELHEIGATKLANTISDLKGFYVKTAQIISTRQDLFPRQYTEALSGFTDNLDPMPIEIAKAVIESELLNKDERFEDVFKEFDPKPLGAASIAQVHRAVLSEKYGGREVAVKVQRPGIESKLLGDIANLKAAAKAFRDNPNLPLDYYTVFTELEKQLADEFDFVAEAVAMDRIHSALARSPIDDSLRDMPIVLPRPVPGLISQRVLVMDYLRGVPLSRAREEMIKKGIDPESPEAKLFGRKLLSALTTAFGRNILEYGFFHADPHPGNIFVMEDGRIGLIDFGQVKQVSGRVRETLCKLVVALDERQDLSRPELDKIGKLGLELGVELNEDAKPEAAAAIGIFLFDGTVDELPGGYDKYELSPNSPVKEIKVLPQDLVLVGRSSILIKGISSRLGIPWSLAKEWAPIAREVLNTNYKPVKAEKDAAAGRVRFREVLTTLKLWGKGRATRVVRSLPSPIRSRVANAILMVQERKRRKQLISR